MKIRDNKRMAEIEMYIWKSGQGVVRPDWSVDFFNAGNLPYDEETDTFTVQDVNYCIAQARDWEQEECEETGAENRVRVKIPTINLVEYNGETEKRPECLFDGVADCANPIIHETMDENPENLKKAWRWLAGKKNTCREMSGTVGKYYVIQAFGIEHCFCDEEGEFIEGSDIDSAEDEVEEKLWYAAMRNRDDDDWGFGSYDLEEAKTMAMDFEDEEAYIAIIQEGDDPICVGEIHQDEF